MCAITSGIKKYKIIIKKKKKTHDNREASISKALNDSCISHEEFV